MKERMLICMVLFFPAFANAQQGDPVNKSNTDAAVKMIPDSLFKTGHFISVMEAEKILGKGAYVKDSLFKPSAYYTRYLFNYKAEKPDKATQQFGTLFFSFEQYNETATAAGSFLSIKSENEKTLKGEELPGTGDEALLVKDAAGFPFVMIRKGNKLFKFKLRNQTGKAALDELLVLAKMITERN